jgi:hypothetical protein
LKQRPTRELVEGVTVTQQLASDVSAVVLSHDGYADLWPAFFELLFRFWPDLPYPLQSRQQPPDFSGRPGYPGAGGRRAILVANAYVRP